MAEVDLVHPELTQRISVIPLVSKCRQFIATPALICAPYHIKSSVSVEVFRAFVATLEGNAADITEGNYTGLSQLCQEFGFDGLHAKLSAFQPSARFTEALRCISELENRVKVNDDQIAVLQKELSSQRESHEQALQRFETEIAKLKEVVNELPARVDRAEVDMARVASEAEEVGKLRLNRTEVDIARVSSEVAALKHWTGGWDSLIIAQFPLRFDEFVRKRFNLLWRGSRDGFTAQEFHLRCDGRANTLTLIADTDGNVFGGFTPVEWESGNNLPVNKGNDSLRSFRFTLRNTHGSRRGNSP
jgi:hypothetical protein